tara:strand:- start:1696 stop:2271 length:576 start_codon:yes stop_codon:yes gene_type:complete
MRHILFSAKITARQQPHDMPPLRDHLQLLNISPRKRSGGGIVIERSQTEDLGAALWLISTELQIVTPDQPIQMTVELPAPVFCDVARISQLFSNLSENAVRHGASGKPIKSAARLVDDDFVLTVANSGDRIPEDPLPTLFMPFEHTSNRPSGEGLGLFIAIEIAKGQGGTLTVASNDLETVFAFRLPKLQT